MAGRPARSAGLFLITPLVSAYLIPGLLSDADGSILLSTPVKLLALLGGISGGTIYARMNSGEASSPTAARISKGVLTLAVLIFAVPAHAALASVLRESIANDRSVHSRHHLDGILEVTVGQVQRLFDRSSMFNGPHRQELQ